MKTLTVIVLMFLMTSCKKQANDQFAPIEQVSKQAPSNLKQYTTLVYDSVLMDAMTSETARPNRDLFVHVSVQGYDQASFLNKGVSYTVIARNMKMQGDYTKSNWIAVRGRGIIAGVQKDVFVQLGTMSLNSNQIDIAFQAWDLQTRSLISGSDLNIQYTGQTVILNDGDLAIFEIVNVEATTWAFKVNGVILFTADLGFDTASNFPPEIGTRNLIEVATESRGGDDFNPQLHVFSMKYFKDGVWNIVASGRSNMSAINVTSGTRVNGWPIEGTSEPSNFYIGGSGAAPPPGTLIW